MILYSLEQIRRFTKHIEIAHHIKGRLRLKFDIAILKEFSDAELGSLAELEKNLSGIKRVRLNKLAKSAAIEYDPQIIPQSTWEYLAKGENLEEIAQFFEKLRSTQ